MYTIKTIKLFLGMMLFAIAFVSFESSEEITNEELGIQEIDVRSKRLGEIVQEGGME